MMSLSSTAGMLHAMSKAQDVTLSAYILWPDSPVEQALEDAARRGAHVTVRLNGYFFHGRSAMLTNNESIVRRLRDLHADARIVHRGDRDGASLHMKAAVCDGVAYLNDRNWLKDGDTVLRDDTPQDVRAIRNAASYRAGHCRSVQLDKGKALDSESRLLAAARGDRVDVAAEEIGYSTVYGALKRLALAGAKPRILVSKQGLRAKYLVAARQLAKAGARVRIATSNEKFAVVGRRRAWLGSANPTSVFYDANQIDWGVRTNDLRIVRRLEAHFNTQWSAATPLQ